MGHGDKDKKKKRYKENIFRQEQTEYNKDTKLLVERQKARNLKKSSWWRKKIALGLCYYCGRSFPPTELTMDHKIPLSEGGKSERNNIVPCCKECNNKKKNFLPWEWGEYLDDIKKR